MITKRFSFKLAVLFSMFVMFMLPSATWHETAHAQGPDVGAADIAVTELSIQPDVVINACGTGTTELRIFNRWGMSNVGVLNMSISFPKNNVQIESVTGINLNAIDFATNASEVVTTKASLIGTLDSANSTGILDLQVSFSSPGVNPHNGLNDVGTASAATIAEAAVRHVPFVKITWKATANGAALPVIFNSATGSDVDGSPARAAKAKEFPGGITVQAPQSNVFIGTLPNDPSRYDKKIGDTFATDVRIDKACGLTRFQAQIPYDNTKVEAVSVIPSALFGNNAINNSTIANNIVKIDIETTTPFNTGGILAQINWKGLAGGESPQDFTTGSIHLFDSAKAEITSPPPTFTKGGIIYIAKKEIVINKDDASTASPDVTLTISNGGNANLASMRIWNDGDAQPETWETLQPTKSWTLKTGAAGTRRVNLKFLNSSNQEIATVYYDDINLTTDYNGTEPTPTQTPTGTLTPIATTVPTATVVPSATPVTPVPTTVPSATPVTPAPTTVPSATPVTPVPTATTPATGDMLTGRVRLQGRGSHTDVKVYADFVPCNAMTPGAANEIPVTLVNNIPSGSTIASDATFNMQNKGYQCLMLVRPGHFSAQRNNPSGNVGYVELPGGDFIVNNSNAINIFDLTYAADKYGKADPLVDFNGVGNVDILDLSVVAANYGRTGPISW